MELPEKAYEIATVAAVAVSQDYRGIVERDDLKQEALLWCVQRPHKVWEWLDEEQEEADLKQGEGRLSMDLRRHLERLARREKAQRYGYEPQDEAFYDAGQLAEILEHVFSYEDWQSNPVQGDKVMSGKDPAEGGNWTASCADVARAVTKLPMPAQVILRLRFEQHKKLRDIGRLFNRSHEWARQQIEKAEDELVELLGGGSPYA